MFPNYAILLGSSPSLRLTADEVDQLFDWTFEIHDHTASRAQTAIFWHRDDNCFYWKHVN
jgi:hypothetical protein